MARTAVVAGTATAVSNRVSRRQAERWSAQDSQSYVPRGYMPPPEQAPPAAGGGDRVEQLKELAGLRDQGVLTEEEFAAEKARILNG